MDDKSPANKGWPWKEVQGGLREAWQEPSGDLVPFAARLKREGKTRVYDLGCGIGRHTVYLAQQGFEVYASDVSADGLDETRRWLDKENLEAELVSSDLTQIPYSDKFFDSILAVNVVYHAMREGVEACLAEVQRALRPEGLFFVTFNSKQSNDYGRGQQVDENTFIKTEGIEKGIPHYFVDRNELDRLLGGFELLRISHKDEWLPELGKPDRAAHWVVWARRP